MKREGALPDPAIYMWPSRSGDLLVFPGYNNIIYIWLDVCLTLRFFFTGVM